MGKQGSSSAKGYGYRWQQARLEYLKRNPLCVECRKQGRITQATVVDHIVPHKGDRTLFWRRSNWQPLCASCHSSHKQRVESSGKVVGCDVDGVPLDPSHHWTKTRGF